MTPPTAAAGGPGAGARPVAPRGALLALAVLSVCELASLAALLVNLATAHWRPLTSALGPTHGALYLAVAAIAVFTPGLRLRTRLLTLIPVAGGVLALVLLPGEARRAAAGRGEARAAD